MMEVVKRSDPRSIPDELNFDEKYARINFLVFLLDKQSEVLRERWEGVVFHK